MSQWNETCLSPHQSYLIMYDYLRTYYEESPNDTMYLMLFAMQVSDDGRSTADPALADEWERSVLRVLRGEVTSADPPAPPSR